MLQIAVLAPRTIWYTHTIWCVPLVLLAPILGCHRKVPWCLPNRFYSCSNGNTNSENTDPAIVNVMGEQFDGRTTWTPTLPMVMEEHVCFLLVLNLFQHSSSSLNCSDAHFFAMQSTSCSCSNFLCNPLCHALVLYLIIDPIYHNEIANVCPSASSIWMGPLLSRTWAYLVTQDMDSYLNAFAILSTTILNLFSSSLSCECQIPSHSWCRLLYGRRWSGRRNRPQMAIPNPDIIPNLNGPQIQETHPWRIKSKIWNPKNTWNAELMVSWSLNL